MLCYVVSFSVVFDDADEAMARVEDDVRRAQERVNRLPALQEATEAVRGRAVSRERDISVEVDHTGQVTGLEIRDAAFSRGGARLSVELVGLLNQARHEVQKQMLAAATDVLGEDDPLLVPYRLSLEAEEEANRADRPGTGRLR